MNAWIQRGESITYDCQSCGACCQTSRPLGSRVARQQFGLPTTDTWANCTTDDVKRMSRRVRLKLVSIVDSEGGRNQAIPLRDDGTCIFLRGNVAEHVKCSIYDERPTICRRFESGSEFCIAARRDMGLPT